VVSIQLISLASRDKEKQIGSFFTSDVSIQLISLASRDLCVQHRRGNAEADVSIQLISLASRDI